MTFDQEPILKEVKDLILTKILSSENLLKAFAVADFECNKITIKSADLIETNIKIEEEEMPTTVEQLDLNVVT